MWPKHRRHTVRTLSISSRSPAPHRDCRCCSLLLLYYLTSILLSSSHPTTLGSFLKISRFGRHSLTRAPFGLYSLKRPKVPNPILLQHMASFPSVIVRLAHGLWTDPANFAVAIGAMERCERWARRKFAGESVEVSMLIT